MHGAKYGLAWAINNLVITAQNSQVIPLLSNLFRNPLDSDNSPLLQMSQPESEKQNLPKWKQWFTFL